MVWVKGLVECPFAAPPSFVLLCWEAPRIHPALEKLEESLGSPRLSQFSLLAHLSLLTFALLTDA